MICFILISGDGYGEIDDMLQKVSMFSDGGRKLVLVVLTLSDFLLW